MTVNLKQSAIDAMDNMDTFVPHHSRPHIIEYITEGKPMGSFFQALFNNDLKNAVANADHVNQSNLVTIVRWLYNYAPSDCWGWTGVYDEWIQAASRRRVANDQRDN